MLIFLSKYINFIHSANYICISFIFLNQEVTNSLMVQNMSWEKIVIPFFSSFLQYLLAVTVRKEELAKIDLCSDLLWPFLFCRFGICFWFGLVSILCGQIYQIYCLQLLSCNHWFQFHCPSLSLK